VNYLWGKTALNLLKKESPSVAAVYFVVRTDDIAYIIKSSYKLFAPMVLLVVIRAVYRMN